MSRLFCGHAESPWMARAIVAAWFAGWVAVGMGIGAIITAIVW